MRGPWSGALRLWEGLGISGEVPGPQAQDLPSMLAHNRKEQTDTTRGGAGCGETLEAAGDRHTGPRLRGAGAGGEWEALVRQSLHPATFAPSLACWSH